MGKVTFQSHKVQLAAPITRVHLFFYDLNNLQKLMPEQVINWHSTEESCSFDIKGMAHIALQRGETATDQFVKIISSSENPIDLEIKGITEKSGNEQTEAMIELSADLSPMLQLMVSGPLQNLVKIMADRLSNHYLPAKQSDG
jgi:hypothetical protein